jgi:hypothetical protein
MSPEMTALARRLVAVVDLDDLPDGWLTHTTKPGGYPVRLGGTEFRVCDFQQLSDAVTEQMFGEIPEEPNWRVKKEIYDLLSKAHDEAYEAAWDSVTPDLDDPATAGLLPHVARKLWGVRTLYVRPALWDVRGEALEGQWEVRSSPDSETPKKLRARWAGSELEAWISCIELAPDGSPDWSPL